jgi:hypothetical protein
MVFAAAARAVPGFARDDPAEVLRGIPSDPAVPPARLTVPLHCPGEDPTVWVWRPVRIWALVRTGRLDEADAALDAFEAHGDARAVVHGARLQASVALARGQLEQAEVILETCNAVADGLADPIARALFDAEYGRCLPGSTGARRRWRGFARRTRAWPASASGRSPTR